MKFSDKAQTVFSCGDCLTKNKIASECSVCPEETKWYSTTLLKHYCSDECLEQEINEMLQTNEKWWEIFKQ